MIDVQELKQKALSYLEKNGPTIPVRIARELNIDPMWAGAILSELLQHHNVKLSSMKVGSTPIYLLEGQEQGLEKFANEHLKGIPKEAYLLLQKEKLLKDAEQEPQTRVALRSLRDFAVMFDKDGEAYWKYAFATEEELKEPDVEESPEEEIEEEAEPEEEKKVEEIFEEAEEEETNQPSLLERVKEKLEKLNIKILEETDIKKRELKILGRMQGNLGETEVLIMAKDKKSLTDKDFEKIFEIISEEKKLVLLFTTGEIAKKSIESYRKYKNLIRVRPL
jgi:DNA-binding Lrp family transcriptional regulator